MYKSPYLKWPKHGFTPIPAPLTTTALHMGHSIPSPCFAEISHCRKEKRRNPALTVLPRYSSVHHQWASTAASELPPHRPGKNLCSNWGHSYMQCLVPPASHSIPKLLRSVPPCQPLQGCATLMPCSCIPLAHPLFYYGSFQPLQILS